MRKFLLAASLLAGCAMVTPASAQLTWQGLSQTVYDPETGDAEQYAITFVLNSTAPTIFNNYPTVPQPGFDIELYNWAFYSNIVSFSIAGPRFNVSVGGENNAFSRVSMLRYERVQGGVTGFTAHAGSEGFTGGYAFDFNYWLEDGFSSTALPTSLNIANAFDAGFALQLYTAIEDTEEFESREVLNFRFASGDFLAAAAPAVPEPASWAMMIGGFALVGSTMRRRQAKVAFA